MWNVSILLSLHLRRLEIWKLFVEEWKGDIPFLPWPGWHIGKDCTLINIWSVVLKSTGSSKSTFISPFICFFILDPKNKAMRFSFSRTFYLMCPNCVTFVLSAHLVCYTGSPPLLYISSSLRISSTLNAQNSTIVAGANGHLAVWLFGHLAIKFSNRE